MALTSSTSYYPEEMTFSTNLNGDWQVQKFQPSEVESPLYLVSKPGAVPPPIPIPPPPPPPSNCNYTGFQENTFPPVGNLLEPLGISPASYNAQSPYYFTCYDSGFVNGSTTFANYEADGGPHYITNWEAPQVIQEINPAQEIRPQATLPQERPQNDAFKMNSRFLRGNRRNARSGIPFPISAPVTHKKQVGTSVNNFVTVTSTFQLPLEDDPICDRSNIPRRQKLERAASVARSKGASNLAQKLEESRLNDRAKSTVEAYSAALDRFVSWWAADPERFKWPQNEARKFYVAHLIDKKSFKTIPQSIAALNYFLGTLEEKDAKVVEALLDTASRETPAAVTTAKATIEDLQGIVMMGTKTRDVTTIRMAAACVLLFRSMMRLGELLLLQNEDLWNDGDGWKVFIRQSNLTVPFNTGTEDEDLLLIELSNKSEDEKRQDNYLLMNANGSRMLHDLFSRNLKSLLYNCGLSQSITSQSFRCGGASYLISNGSSVESVMQMGRWKCAEAFRRHVYSEDPSVEVE